MERLISYDFKLAERFFCVNHPKFRDFWSKGGFINIPFPSKGGFSAFSLFISRIYLLSKGGFYNMSGSVKRWFYAPKNFFYFSVFLLYDAVKKWFLQMLYIHCNTGHYI